MLADDLKLFSEQHLSSPPSTFQLHLDMIQQWSKTWQFPIFVLEVPCHGLWVKFQMLVLFPSFDSVISVNVWGCGGGGACVCV